MTKQHTYLIALGSNQRSSRHGTPRQILAAAVDWLEPLGDVVARSAVTDSAPVGPSQRQYANGAAVLLSAHEPHVLLTQLHKIESVAGRVRRGQPWRSRVLDLDIVLWSGGIIAAGNLKIPHPLFRKRSFVLGPAASIAPRWRDPLSGLTLQQLNARLTRNRRATR